MSTFIVMVILALGMVNSWDSDGHYGHSRVTILRSNNFYNNVYSKNNDYIWLVLFYDLYCGHCQDFSPIYKEVANMLEGFVEVGAVECGGRENSDLKQDFNIERFPAMRLFKGGKPMIIEGITANQIVGEVRRALGY
ncbi:unnamed protein product [Diamesa hyperborea]